MSILIMNEGNQTSVQETHVWDNRYILVVTPWVEAITSVLTLLHREVYASLPLPKIVQKANPPDQESQESLVRC